MPQYVTSVDLRIESGGKEKNSTARKRVEFVTDFIQGYTSSSAGKGKRKANVEEESFFIS